MHKNNITKCCGLLNKCIVLLSISGSLVGMVNASDHTKCISLNNQLCMTQPTLINLYPNGIHSRITLI